MFNSKANESQSVSSENVAIQEATDIPVSKDIQQESSEIDR